MRRIIVDSGSSIKPDEAKEMGIDVIPIRVMIGGVEYSDGVDIDSTKLYELMAETKEFPKTSLPHLDLVEEMVDKYLAQGDEVLIISLSSGLSSTYSAIASMLLDKKNVAVFDSKNAAGGMRILTLEALKMADKPMDEVIARLTEVRSKIRLVSLTATLDYLLKGGRLKKSAWMVGTLLRILPIISLDPDGKVVSIAKVRGLHGGVKWLCEMPLENGDMDLSMPIVASYTRSRVNLDKVVAYYESKGIKPTHYDDLTATLAAHWGPDAIGVFYCVK